MGIDVNLLVIGLAVVGLLMLVIFIDLFFIPTAVISIVCSFGFFVYLFFVAFIKKELFTAMVLLLIFFVISGFGVYLIKKKKLFNVIALANTVPKEAPIELKSVIGKRGIAKTDLRPSGKVVLEGETFDVLSTARQIKKGAAVEVVSISGAQLVVKAVLKAS